MSWTNSKVRFIIQRNYNYYQITKKNADSFQFLSDDDVGLIYSKCYTIIFNARARKRFYGHLYIHIDTMPKLKTLLRVTRLGSNNGRDRGWMRRDLELYTARPGIIFILLRAQQRKWFYFPSIKRHVARLFIILVELVYPFSIDI